MNVRNRRIASISLSFSAAALLLFTGPARAQIVGPPASEVPLPTRTATDSPVVVKTDTIRSPIGVMAGVRVPEIGPEYLWRGDAIFATGAVTLADLLERVPGITILRSGGILSPQIPRHMGSLGRVKFYLDGVELDNLDRRSESLDLSWIPLWTLEEVRIDRSAGELRVSMRTLTVTSTTPYTRTDVFTGDEETNIYRGFYGKRFGGGQGIQLGAEQSSNKSVRGGTGDKLSVLSRVGMARGRWSVDAFANRTHGRRDLHKSLTQGRPIPEYDASSTYAYLRLVGGNAARGPWLAAILSHLANHESSPRADSARSKTNLIPIDTADTARSERQILLRSGFTQPSWRATVEDRIRNLDARTYHDITGAAEVSVRILAAGARVKQSAFSTSRMEAWAKFQPLSFLAVNGAYAKNTAPSESSPVFSATTPDFTFAQIEAGVRLFGPWLSGGMMTQDTLVQGAPGVFNQGFLGNTSGGGTAKYVTLRGTFHRDYTFDVFTLRWDKDVFYRPTTQTRAEFRYRTQWLSRFPKREFELNTALTHNYSSRTFFRVGEVAGSIDASQHLDFLLEIRILRGVASYQLRNVTGYAYENLPGFFAQRSLNLYGIRWEFWN